MSIDIVGQWTATKDALRIAEVLSSRGVPADRALRFAELAIRIADPGVYDAAIMRGAELVFGNMDGLAGKRKLMDIRPENRERHIRTVMYAMRGIEQVLTGTFGDRDVHQLHADYHTHRAQIQDAAEKARREMAVKVVAFGGVQ